VVDLGQGNRIAPRSADDTFDHLASARRPGPAHSPPDEEITMATRRTTSSKRERERNKQAKAAAKRERRQDRSSDTESDAAAFDENTATTDELIERIAAMHEQYDAGQISFEDFDEEKTELMALLTARLSE
jgi:hypothetical protein